jgi:serine/threonine-protein kinase
MSDNSSIDIAPGDTIAGYRLEAQLGAGGMAVVFRAHDERLDRRVALKILPPGLALDTAFRTRFIRESRAAATVDHPNIIPIYDAGENKNFLYIAMRYVAGGDVKSLLAAPDPVPPKRVATIIAQAADALDAANSQGLIHRDVKPANILLDPVDISSDQPIHSYLCDFGISQQTLASHLTSTGQFVGTLDYIPPEQIEGRMVDGRADQYALACTAFETLTGKPPYDRTLGIALINAHLSQPPPKVTDLRRELPSAVNAVIARAMAKSPADRFANCLEFATALQSALDGQIQLVPSAPETNPHLGTAVYMPPAGLHPEPTQVAISSIPPLPVLASGDGSLMARLASIRSLSLPLKSTFRYVHESTGVSHGVLPSLGNDSLVHELENRIKHSRGGSFLITGFRGVGKSTVVDRLLGALRQSPGANDLLVPVSLSVARTTTTERLLFAIVRRVFESILDIGAFDQLPLATRRSLLLAYMRTSLSFNETRTETREKSAVQRFGDPSA